MNPDRKAATTTTMNPTTYIAFLNFDFFALILSAIFSRSAGGGASFLGVVRNPYESYLFDPWYEDELDRGLER